MEIRQQDKGPHGIGKESACSSLHEKPRGYQRIKTWITRCGGDWCREEPSHSNESFIRKKMGLPKQRDFISALQDSTLFGVEEKNPLDRFLIPVYVHDFFHLFPFGKQISLPESHTFSLCISFRLIRTEQSCIIPSFR